MIYYNGGQTDGEFIYQGSTLNLEKKLLEIETIDQKEAIQRAYSHLQRAMDYLFLAGADCGDVFHLD